MINDISDFGEREGVGRDKKKKEKAKKIIIL